MTISEQASEAFKDFEKSGWAKQAENYDGLVGQVTRQAVNAILAAVNARAGTKLLDVASGPGYVAAEAAQRGVDATGVDIAENMVAEAQRRFSGPKYELGDAEHLHYAEESFDAATCAFGMLHFPRPGKAVAEVFRVLRPNGRFAFTVWCGPEKAKVLSLIASVMQKHTDGSVQVPAGPGLFMFSDPWVATGILEAASFIEVRVDELPCSFAPSSPSGLFEMMHKSMVRAAHVYDRQSNDVQRRIQQAMSIEAAKALVEGQGKIACNALLVTGTKPAI